MKRELKTEVVGNIQPIQCRTESAKITPNPPHQSRLHTNKLNIEINKHTREFAFKKNLNGITNASSRKLILYG